MARTDVIAPQARQRIDTIAEWLSDRDFRTDLLRGSLPWFKTTVIYPWFCRFLTDSSKFHHTNSCTACGLCSKMCPCLSTLKNGRHTYVLGICTEYIPPGTPPHDRISLCHWRSMLPVSSPQVHTMWQRMSSATIKADDRRPKTQLRSGENSGHAGPAVVDLHIDQLLCVAPKPYSRNDASCDVHFG